jgi:hypothetical protein
MTTSDVPVLEFASHVRGKNAKVRIYSNRIEWEQPRGLSAGKLTAGLATGGLSLLATGVKSGRAGMEMLPAKAITSVSSRRDGMLNTVVSVNTAAGAIDFRVSHSDAERIRGLLTDLILN